MNTLLEKAFAGVVDPKNNEYEGYEFTEPPKIVAKMKSIDSKGTAFIKFVPPIAIVPNDWKKLWDRTEREKMSFNDQIAYDQELLKIMHI